MQKKGVETLIQQVQTTAANPVESEQIDLPEVVLQPLPMNAKVAEQHHFAHDLLEEMLFKRGIFKPYFMGEGKHGKPFLLEHPQIQFNISHCKNAALWHWLETVRRRRGNHSTDAGTCIASSSDCFGTAGNFTVRITRTVFFAVLDTKRELCKGVGRWDFLSDADAGIFPARATCNGRNAVPCTEGKWRNSRSDAGICCSRSRGRIPILSGYLGAEASLFRLYSQGRITEKGSRMCHSAPFFFGISKKEINPYPCRCPDIHLR